MRKLLGRGPRAGAICLAGLVALLASLALGGGRAPAASQPTEAPWNQTSLLLRLRDLPTGYRLLDFGPSPEYDVNSLDCEEVHPANTQPRLDDFLTRYSPSGCMVVYIRLFRVPGAGPEPAAIGSGAMDTDSVEGAEAGLRVAPELLSHLLQDQLPEAVPAPEVVGDAARLFHWQHPTLFDKGETGNSSFFVWRSGSVVASVFASGGSDAADDRAAIAAARVQQRRIEAPAPANGSDFFDPEVALENPGLDIPVYWLGRDFDPGHGLHRLHLEDSGSNAGGPTKEARALMIYTDSYRLAHTEAIELELFSHRQWRQLRRERAELPGTLLCSTSRTVKVPHGRAIITSGYERGFWEGKHSPCSRIRKHPRLTVARVFLPGVIAVAQTMDYCGGGCVPRGKGPYDSAKGMRTIARRLVLRPRPKLRP